MKKIVCLFVLLACTLFGSHATEPVAPVVTEPVDNVARVVSNVTGWFETSSGHTEAFTIGSNLRIPEGTTEMDLFIYTPVLSSYTFTASNFAEIVKYSSGNYVHLSCSGTQLNTLIGAAINVSGYCPETGQNETFLIAFLPPM